MCCSVLVSAALCLLLVPRVTASFWLQPFPPLNETCSYRRLPIVVGYDLLNLADAVRFQSPSPLCGLSDLHPPLPRAGRMTTIAQHTRRVFVMYYLPYCPISQELLPLFEAAATMFPSEAFVVLDATHDSTRDLFPTRAFQLPAVVAYTVPYSRRVAAGIRKAWLITHATFSAHAWTHMRTDLYPLLVQFVSYACDKPAVLDPFSAPLQGGGGSGWHSRTLISGGNAIVQRDTGFVKPRPLTRAHSPPVPVAFTAFCSLVTVVGAAALAMKKVKWGDGGRLGAAAGPA